MSDWGDDFYDDGEEEEELSFEEDEGSDEDERMDSDSEGGRDDKSKMSEDEPEVGLEELYYQGKGSKEDEMFEAALSSFQKMIDQKTTATGDNAVYVFKAIKQAIKVCQEMGKYDQALEYLDLFFAQKAQVDKSYGETSLSKLVHRMCQSSRMPASFLESVYHKFLEHLQEDRDSRLYYRVRLSMANVMLNEGKAAEAASLLRELERRLTEGAEGVKNTLLLDVIASEMVCASRYRFDLDELRRLSRLANSLNTGIPQSLIVGVVNECSGLVSMYDEDFAVADKSFQDSFRGFNECGNDRRKDVLLKFIVSNLLSESEINPFKSSDIQGFLGQDKPRALMSAYDAVHDVDIDRYNGIVQDAAFGKMVAGDKFLQTFLPYVTELVQVKYILKYTKVFRRLSFARLCTRLHIEASRLEAMLLKLIGSGKLRNVKLDLVDQVVEHIEDGSVLSDELTPDAVLANLLKYRDYSNVSLGLLPQEAEIVRERALESSSHEQGLLSISLAQLHPDSNDISRPAKRSSTGRSDMGQEHIPGKPDGMGEVASISMVGGTPENSAKLLKLQQDLCVPFKKLPKRRLLEDLYVTSLVGQVGKGVQTKEDLLKVLNDYLGYIKSAIPAAQRERISHLESVRRGKLEEEFEKLHKGDDADSSMGALSGNADKIIPEVRQSTDIVSLEPSHDEPDAGELEMGLSSLSKDQIRDRKMQSVVELVRSIDQYRVGFVFGAKKRSKHTVMDPDMRGPEEMRRNSRRRRHDMFGRRRHEMGPSSMFDHSAERFDSESLDSRSIGEFEDDF